MSGPAASDVLKEAAKMMGEYLLEEEGLSHLTPEELVARLEITKIAATGVLGTSFFMAEDSYALCKALGFDLGIAVRKLDGTEFVFYPARNFGLNSVQTIPKPAKQEEPPVSSTPAPASKTILLSAEVHGPVSALPFAKPKRAIGFIQQFLHPTPKAEPAAQDADAILGSEEYEV